MKRYKATCDLLEILEVADKIYKGVTTSKTPIRADANCDSQIRKQKGGEAASPIDPRKGRAGKHKTKNAGHPSNQPTKGKTCLLHVPAHFKE